MAPKTFKQVFARDFRGVDGLSSSIEEEIGTFNRAVNYEMSVGNSIRGRVGSQVSGLTGAITDSAATSSVFNGQFYGLFPYSYTRTVDEYAIRYRTGAGVYPNQTPTLDTTLTAADGASISKLIGMNEHLWVLDTMDVVVTYVSGTYPFTWYTYVNGSNINFVIKANGVSILDTSLGDGITTNTSIYTLLSTINALAELSVSRTTRDPCPPYGIATNAAVVTVGSATYGTQYRITCSAHNFFPGDIITFPTTPARAGFVVAVNTAGTNIDYVGQSYQPGTGDILGYMNQSAACFPITTAASASSGNLTLSFPYWRHIPEGDRIFGQNFIGSYNSWANKTQNGFYAPATSTAANGNLYIAASSQVSNGTANYPNNLIKLDGKQPVRAGLPQALMTTAAGGAGALTGTFKYKAFYRRVDAQGNIVEGKPSAVSSITLAAQQTTITPTFTNIDYAAGSGWGGRSAYKDTAEAPTAGQFFLVDNSTGGAAFLQPGDPICLLDSTAAKVGLSLGTFHRTVCTAYHGTIPPSIRVADSSGYTIPNNIPMSTGLSIVFLRTAVGGNQYYVLAEAPVTGYTNFTVTDNVTDAVLTAGEQYIEVPIGKEHDPPPPCTLVCQHQGGLVVARGPLTPNTVGFSTAEGIEYFPTASNAFDVPSTQSGFITAIASDTDDRLAVFKERAYYDVVGALDEGVFSINVRNEGDYGISDQGSLVRVKEKLIGLCEAGFVTIRDGFLDSLEYQDLNARIVGQPYQFHWTVACNDYVNRNYICCIPQVSGEPVTYVLDYSRGGVRVFDRSYTTKIDPAGGQALVDTQFYHLSATTPYQVFRRLIRFNANSPSGNGDGDSFIDNTNAISYILESSPINFGEPALLKSPIRLRTWSIPNDYVVEGWVPFSLLVETGASPIASYVGGINPNATSTTTSFATANDVFQDVKLVKCRTHFYIVRYTTNTIRTSPFITGYEIMFAENYEKEDLIK